MTDIPSRTKKGTPILLKRICTKTARRIFPASPIDRYVLTKIDLPFLQYLKISPWTCNCRNQKTNVT
jgi:hypothetical protein